MNDISNEKLKELINNFSSFLNVSAESIMGFSKNDKSEYFLNNWLQANWEMIVEYFVSQEIGKSILLKQYGEGADELFESLLDGQHYRMRVSLPSMRPTYKIMCLPIKDGLKCLSSNELINFPNGGLEFRQLISLNYKGQYVGFFPSFDKVLISETSMEYADKPTNEYSQESIVLINDLIFTLVETVPVMDYYIDEETERGQTPLKDK